jgi:hypothetical protein
MNIMNEKQADKKWIKIIVQISEVFSIIIVIGLSIVAVEQLLPSSSHPLRLQVFLWLFVAANSVIFWYKVRRLLHGK